MQIGSYIAIAKLAAKFSRSYSKAIKTEQARDGDVSWWDYITCILDAAATLSEADVEPLTKVVNKQRKK